MLSLFNWSAWAACLYDPFSIEHSAISASNEHNKCHKYHWNILKYEANWMTWDMDICMDKIPDLIYTNAVCNSCANIHTRYQGDRNFVDLNLKLYIQILRSTRKLNAIWFSFKSNNIGFCVFELDMDYLIILCRALYPRW